MIHRSYQTPTLGALSFAAGLVFAGGTSAIATSSDISTWLMGIAAVLASVAAILEARTSRGLYDRVVDHETRIRVLESKTH